MKLNLGCGQSHMEGYVNVDKFAECEPDMVVDLESFPWPWPDNSATEVVLRHVLEHLGQEPGCFLNIMRELWRVCADGAKIDVAVPHPRHDYFLDDPTHVRAITPAMFALFDRQVNMQHKEQGVSRSALGLYTGTDFVTTNVELVADPRWHEALNSSQLDLAAFQELSRQQNNVIEEYRIELMARKSPPPTQSA
jgi:predicted SAM-dependent methyltransferase